MTKSKRKQAKPTAAQLRVRAEHAHKTAVFYAKLTARYAADAGELWSASERARRREARAASARQREREATASAHAPAANRKERAR